MPVILKLMNESFVILTFCNVIEFTFYPYVLHFVVFLQKKSEMIKNLSLITFLLCLLVCPAKAQMLLAEMKDDTLRHKHIDEVTVYGFAANKLSLPYVEVGKPILEARDFRSPADALQAQPGIFTSRDGIWATSVNVRGMSEARMLILTDDDRILTSSDISAALSTVDLGAVERIEVVKGAASVLYGTGAMGGVVNFVSERPAYTTYLESSGRVATGFSSANSLWANSATVNVTNVDWYLSATGSYRTAQNMHTALGELPNTQFNDASWGLKGGMKYGDSQELLVNYNHFEAWDVGLPGGSAFPSAATVRYTGIERNQLSGEYIFSELTDVITSLRIKSYMQNISRDVENAVNANRSIYPSSLNTTTGVKSIAELYFNDYNTMTVGAEFWNRKTETSRVRIDKVAGTEHDYIFTGELPIPEASMSDVGVFGQYRKVLDPNRWVLNTGLRLDFIQTASDTSFKEIFKYSKNTNTLQRTEMSPNKTVFFYPASQNELSYAVHVDLQYKPTRRQQIILSLANSYRAASIEERFKYIEQGAIVKKGNPQLKPENGLFSNLSYQLTGTRLSFKTDVFANYLMNLIAELPQQGSPNLFVNTNVDEALFIGGEAELQWLIFNHLKLLTNVSYTRARDLGKDVFLPQIPPLNGVLSLNYLWDKVLATALSVEMAAAQREISPAEILTDGYVVLNWDVRSVPIAIAQTSVQFFGGIDNVLNKEYYNHLTVTRTGGTKYAEPGRNLYVKAKMSW